MLITKSFTGKTSVVMCAYDNDFASRCITLTALNCLRRFTDTEDYELILVDTGSNTDTGVPYYRWDIVKPDKHIKTDNIGYSAAMNLGVEQSNSENTYLVLMHNDMFVQEGWLSELRYCLDDDLGDVIYPEQIARTRDEIRKMYRGEVTGGWDDAGLAMISQENYKKCGGYDDDFRSVHQELVFQLRYGKIGLRRFCSTKVFVTHIGGVTYRRNEEVFLKNMEREDLLLKEKYNK